MHLLLRSATATLFAMAANASAQPAHDHAMPSRTLLTARCASEEVVPRAARASDATATGAFVIAADGKQIAYRITWDGLVTGAATRIDIHNFGRGGAGQRIFTLCGEGTRACPQGPGGTLQGTWEISPAMLRELAVERTYVDIHTPQAKDGELRGQIVAVPWMIHSEQYIGRLRNGTATLYVTPFPQGTQLQLDITVEGLAAGTTVVELRRAGAIVGRLPVDGGTLRRHGPTISGVLPNVARSARLDERALAALRTGRATMSVVVNGRAVASGPLEPVK